MKAARVPGAAAAAPGLGLGSLILLQDGLGGIVGIPGVVVGYMALSGVLLGTAALASAGRLARSRRLALVAAVPGLLLVLAAAVPAIPVFATLVLLAGAALPPILAATHGAGAGRVPVGVLGGLAGAVLVAAVWQDMPRLGLAVAGIGSAVLGLTAIAGEGGRIRDRLRHSRAALAAHAGAGYAVGAVLLPGAHLLLFRWEVFGADRMYLLLAAVAAGALLVVPLARLVGDVPALLVVAACGPVLCATAPAPAALAAGVAAGIAGAGAAVVRLDHGHPPDAACALVLLGGGLAGIGGDALAAALTGAGSALTVNAIPVALLALLSIRTLPAPGRTGPPLALHRLSSRELYKIGLVARPGEIVALYGPGAVDLLDLLAGERPAEGGRILSDGCDITRLDAARRAELGICRRIPHRPAADHRTVAERLSVLGGVARSHRVLDAFPSLRARRSQPVARIDDEGALLLGFAEALLAEPRFVLVDARELDPALAVAVTGLARTGAAVVLAEPALELAAALPCRAHVLKRGRIAKELVRPTERQLAECLEGRP
ncbi:hypothetical protein [Actinocorallia longicatena]|uniref:Uncharacterized protein n=1 Tax=Actinocorallia longicatena TaxID=111803 RepID=A0ABP6Q4G3_9ACTN